MAGEISPGRMDALSAMGSNPSPDDSQGGDEDGGTENGVTLADICDALGDFTQHPDMSPEMKQDLDQARELIEKHATRDSEEESSEEEPDDEMSEGDSEPVPTDGY
jgi:hypothetical protein